MKKFLKYVVMYLTMLLPRNRRIYVFGAWLGEKFADNARSLYIDALKEGEVTAVWISKNKGAVKEARATGGKAYLDRSFLGIIYQLRAKYAIVTNGISDLNHMLLGGARFINLWHGVPLKKIGYDDEYGKPWSNRSERVKFYAKRLPLGNEYEVVTSEFFRYIYKSAFHARDRQILLFGQPRNDLFYEEEGGYHEVHTDFTEGIVERRKQGRKIILYAPTHRREGKEAMQLDKRLDYAALNRLCEEAGADFYIRKHFYHRDEMDDLAAYSHIYDVTNESADVQTLLKYTDILITDYSSIYIDYLLLDRPVIFYAYDLEDYLKEDRQLYVPYDGATPGAKVRNFADLETSLRGLLSGQEDAFAEERHLVRDMFYDKTAQQKCGPAILKHIAGIR